MARRGKASVVFKSNAPAVVQATKDGMKRRLVTIGAEVERRAKQAASVGGGKAQPGDEGAYYYDEPLNRWVRGSAPGSPPHKQTGNLYASIRWAFDSAHSVIIGPTVIYGKWLEFGTRMMVERPFMRPTLASIRPFIARWFSRLF